MKPLAQEPSRALLSSSIGGYIGLKCGFRFMPFETLLKRGLAFDGEPAHLWLPDFWGLQNCARWLFCFFLCWSLALFLLKRGGDRGLFFGGLCCRVFDSIADAPSFGGVATNARPLDGLATAESVLTPASTDCSRGVPLSCGHVTFPSVTCEDFCGTRGWGFLRTGIRLSFRGIEGILSLGRRARYVASPSW